LAAALDCDVLVCCVDRPWPRYLLNVIAYSHLIPVIDGGVMARVKPDGTPLHVAWRIYTVGPDHACMVCLGALRRSDVKLDMDGKLDDPDYIKGLSEEDKARFSRRNVFPFSMSVAAHEVLQLVGRHRASADRRRRPTDLQRLPGRDAYRRFSLRPRVRVSGSERDRS
jgi:hypothetical protein